MAKCKSDDINNEMELFNEIELNSELEFNEWRELHNFSKLKAGHLELYIGPMFSGKTTQLLTTVSRHADSEDNLKVAYVNSTLDVRITEGSDGYVSTHNSIFKFLSPKIKGFKVHKLSEVDAEKYDMIAVDEGQFFPDLYDTILKWVNEYKIRVYISSLDGDSFRNPIGDVLKLIPHSNICTKLNAVCRECSLNKHLIRADAPFTARLSTDINQIKVGGNDIYLPMCRRHHDSHLSKFK